MPAGTLDPSPIFDLTVPIEDAATAYQAMSGRSAMKALITP